MRWIGFVIGLLALPAFILVPSGAPAGGAEPCTITGTDGDDVLVGTSGPDVMCGLGGDDDLRGRGGDDVLDGGDGADLLAGADGADHLLGGDGVDVLSPGTGDDMVDGDGSGNQDLADQVSYRNVTGGGVTIDLAGGTATGAGGSDTLISVASAVGTAGDDTLVGDSARNLLLGLGGDDLLVPGRGRAYVRGGDGDDTLDFSTLDVPVDISGKTIRLDGAGSMFGIERVYGTPHDDSMTATDAAERLFGRGGDDYLQGLGGDDRLFGGAGDDRFLQGDGDDRIDGGPGRDETAFWRLPFRQGVWVDLDDGVADKGNGFVDELTSIEVVVGTFGIDHLYGGLGATDVWMDGMLGQDDINTVDGFDGDTMESYRSVCVGDPGDTNLCVPIS